MPQWLGTSFHEVVQGSTSPSPPLGPTSLIIPYSTLTLECPHPGTYPFCSPSVFKNQQILCLVCSVNSIHNGGTANADSFQPWAETTESGWGSKGGIFRYAMPEGFSMRLYHVLRSELINTVYWVFFNLDSFCILWQWWVYSEPPGIYTWYFLPDRFSIYN